MTEAIKCYYLQMHPLFANVCEQDIIEAASVMKIKRAYPGEVISYVDGELSKIYLLITGKIKLSELSNDNELIKDIITAPDIFGVLNMEGRSSEDEYAEVLSTDALICGFDIRDFKKLLLSIPMLAISYANMIIGKLGRLEHRHSDLVFYDTKTRLQHFIKNWARTDGNKVGDRVVLFNFLTHSDIANVISASRQSVTILLNELREDGLLFYNRKQIELSNSVYWN